MSKQWQLLVGPVRVVGQPYTRRRGDEYRARAGVHGTQGSACDMRGLSSWRATGHGVRRTRSVQEVRVNRQGSPLTGPRPGRGAQSRDTDVAYADTGYPDRDRYPQDAYLTLGSYPVDPGSVSYTHLTLPTIYSV